MRYLSRRSFLKKAGEGAALISLSSRETPHDVFIAWLSDMLGVLTENDIGWAFWNFRGDFGVLDSRSVNQARLRD